MKNQFDKVKKVQSRYKIKDKKYARPLMLSTKDFSDMLLFDIKALNPDVDIDKFFKNLD